MKPAAELWQNQNEAIPLAKKPLTALESLHFVSYFYQAAKGCLHLPIPHRFHLHVHVRIHSEAMLQLIKPGLSHRNHLGPHLLGM